MMKKSMFVLLLVCGLWLSVPALSVPAQGAVTVTPANTQLELYPEPDPPFGPGGEQRIFSFDLLISDPDGFSAIGFQATLGVDLPGLVYDDEYNDPYDPEVEVARYVSQDVANDPDYWIYGNSGGASYGCPEGSNEFGFQDFTANSGLQPLAVDDLMARYSFIWDGTPGDYTFTFNLDPGYSLVLDQFWVSHAIAFDPGTFTGGSNWFTVYIPEPATLVLFGLGTAVLLRKRRV